jgi:hypothetical protein
MAHMACFCCLTATSCGALKARKVNDVDQNDLAMEQKILREFWDATTNVVRIW